MKPTELEWPSTWTDRLGRDRTPSILGHEFAGVVTALNPRERRKGKTIIRGRE
jgi:D-arabinose 1-dehydrogenase-like Zn-dependent alcohol dehydrogenase